VQQRQQAPLQPAGHDVGAHHAEVAPPAFGMRAEHGHGERQRVLLGTQPVDVRTGDVPAPGVTRHREPRQHRVVEEALLLGIELRLQLPGPPGLVAGPPLHPVPGVGEHIRCDDETGADER
jgi:hypothetical protein